MYFDFSDSLWVGEEDLNKMCELCKEENYTPQEALNWIASGWEDEEFYLVGLVEEQIIEEIKKRLKA